MQTDTVYFLIKIIHVSCAVISISGFVLRGLWIVQQSRLLQHPLTRRLPHFNDALLLISALVMVVMSGQYPFVLNWLTAKVLALLVYILLGMLALKWGRTRRVKITAWLLALLTFGYVVSVALSRSALGLLVYI